jgi:hypothetical protein
MFVGEPIGRGVDEVLHPMPQPVPHREQSLDGQFQRYDEEFPAVAPDGGLAAMNGDEPLSYYGTSRSAAAHWENRLIYGSLHALMTFDALGAAPLLTATPLLVVHGRSDA